MTPWRLAAICPAGLALAAFLTMSWLYCYGPREIYEEVLRSWGIVPFRAPFLDIGFVLAAWDCTRQGWDVMWHNPCDLLQLPFNYSPLWLVAAPIRLSVRDATAVGWTLDLLFIASLTLLPPPRRLAELALVLAATLSTMAVFALERANADVLLFLLALAAGLLAECGLAARIIGYGLVLFAALLKYYPAVVFIILFRERPAVFAVVAVAVTVLLAGFWRVRLLAGARARLVVVGQRDAGGARRFLAGIAGVARRHYSAGRSAARAWAARRPRRPVLLKPRAAQAGQPVLL